MADYLTIITEQLRISIWVLVLVALWSAVWKLIALWKSARKGSLIWFILLAIFNTLGILPMLYIFIFSKMKCCEINSKKRTSNKKKKK